MAFEFKQICGTCGGSGSIVIPPDTTGSCSSCDGVGSYTTGSIPDFSDLADNVKKILEILEKS